MNQKTFKKYYFSPNKMTAMFSIISVLCFVSACISSPSLQLFSCNDLRTKNLIKKAKNKFWNIAIRMSKIPVLSLL
jgi:hypothetical protein